MEKAAMTITIHFQWWMIPTLITVLSFSWALFWPFEDGAGFLSGLANLFAFVPASVLSMISWIIAGVLK
jgi:hypothetical protein